MSVTAPQHTGDGLTQTGFDTVRAALAAHDCHPRGHSHFIQALCPSHDDHKPSLAVYRKPGRVKIVCFGPCDVDLDVLPALGLSWRDKIDAPRVKTPPRTDFQAQARIQARQAMTAPQKAVESLLALPDLGERLCNAIAATETQQSRPDYWLSRAREWFDAQPRPDDFPGGLPMPRTGYNRTPRPVRRRTQPLQPTGGHDIGIALGLRGDVLQAIQEAGRTGLAWNLAFLDRQIADYARRTLLQESRAH